MDFIYNDDIYNIKITKKHNKNLYIKVDSNLNINVTCPYLYTNNSVKKIILDNKKSIINMIEKQKKRNLKKEKESLLGNKIEIIYENVKKPLFENNKLVVKDDIMKESWYKQKAFEVYEYNLKKIYDIYQEFIPFPKLKVRLMKTRWGVCNRRDNSVTLNLELIKMDEKYLNYVIIHELSHFIYFDHSKNFWMQVSKYCPDYKKIRKELKE